MSAAMLVFTVFLMSGFLRADGRVFKVTGKGQVSADNKKLTLQLEMVTEGGAVPTRGVTPAGKTPGGVTTTGMTPGGVTPTGMTPGGVTPTGVTPGGVTPTGVTPGGGTTTGVTPGGVSQGGTTPTGAGPSQTGAGEFSQMELDALEEHNKFRATHGVPPMTLDKTMCQQAAAYAQELARRGDLMHSTNRERQGQGENLSMGCTTVKGQTVREAVVNWYNEVCDPGYQFGVKKSQPGAGHFSQVVWKTSTVLGIGKAESNRNGMKCSYIVARYKPGGNFAGSYTQNVLRGTFQQSYCATI